MFVSERLRKTAWFKQTRKKKTRNKHIKRVEIKAIPMGRLWSKLVSVRRVLILTMRNVHSSPLVCLPLLRRPKWSLLSLLRYHPVKEREKRESLDGVMTALCMFSDSNLYKFVLWVFSKSVITIFCYAQGPLLVWLHKRPMPKSCTGSLCPSCLSLLFFFCCNYPSSSNMQGSPRTNFWTGRV